MVHCETWFFVAVSRAEVYWAAKAYGFAGPAHWLCLLELWFGTVDQRDSSSLCEFIEYGTEHRAYNKSGKQGECCILSHQHFRNSRTRHSMVGGTGLPCWPGITHNGSRVSGGWCGCKGGTPAFRAMQHDWQSPFKYWKGLSAIVLCNPVHVEDSEQGWPVHVEHKRKMALAWKWPGCQDYIQPWLGFVTVCNCKTRHADNLQILTLFCLLGFFYLSTPGMRALLIFMDYFVPN